MKDKTPPPPKKSPDPAPPQTRDFQLDPAGDATVEHYPAPPATRPELHIHPRRPLPAVPVAPSTPDKDASKDATKKEDS
jgi:hypothetical protein